MSLAIKRVASKVRAPVEHFLATQAAGGIVLLVAAAIALIWANLDHHGYHDFWHTEITLGMGIGSFEPITMSLKHWIDDFFMTFFFMVAGFEIKRELVDGELSELSRAMLPIGAAIGGMLVPALIYFGFNPSGDTSGGWGIPMATDIAFAVGVLALLGDRASSALRILLLALAIIDDLGAILVIAIFYSDNVSMAGITLAGSGVGILLLFRILGVKPGFSYLIPLLIMWLGLKEAGVHPTLAGVIAALFAPSKPKVSASIFMTVARGTIRKFEQEVQSSGERDEAKLVKSLRTLVETSREAVSPVVRLEKAFAPWVAFVIMPVFALANAGVYLGNVSFAHDGAMSVFLGVSLGLALGKPLGVVAITWLMLKLKLCNLPKGLNMRGVAVLGFFAGIGFTMSIFIGQLAFNPGNPYLEIAKVAILAATVIAAVLGLIIGRFGLKPQTAEMKAITPQQAESSTEY